VTPKGTRPEGFRERPVVDDDEPDILEDIAAHLAGGEALPLLAEVSALVAALDLASEPVFGREVPDAEMPSLDELVGRFGEVDRRETTALLAALAVLARDELVRARAGRLAGRRRHPLPDWLAGLGAARHGKAVAVTHLLGDGEDLLVEVVLPGGDAAPQLTVVLYVDHNLGTVAKDGFAVGEPIDSLVSLMEAETEADGGARFAEVDPADARARIEEAIEQGSLLWPPLESDTWPASRPMLEWVARLLPGGGTGYVRPEWDDDARSALIEAFFASPHAAGLDDPDHRDLFESIVWFAVDYGPGDPLRWSPPAVEILLGDWIPRKIVAPASFLAKVPDVLRAFVAYAHAERGVPARYTAETLEAVDRFEGEYQDTIRRPRPQGPLALLAAMGALDPDGDVELAGELAALFDPARAALAELRRAVGGDEALAALDDRPLPDEDFAWDGIADDVTARVGEVLAHCDACCDTLLDVEYRTACRRLLATVALAAPDVFRRKGRASRTSSGTSAPPVVAASRSGRPPCSTPPASSTATSRTTGPTSPTPACSSRPVAVGSCSGATAPPRRRATGPAWGRRRRAAARCPARPRLVPVGEEDVGADREGLGGQRPVELRGP
jgi:hypothetical protein